MSGTDEELPSTPDSEGHTPSDTPDTVSAATVQNSDSGDDGTVLVQQHKSQSWFRTRPRILSWSSNVPTETDQNAEADEEKRAKAERKAFLEHQYLHKWTDELLDSYKKGYPHFAAYQNSDPTFKLYRRFGTLRNRVILHRQWELAKLEKQLIELDEKDFDSNNKHRIQSIRRDAEDKESARQDLIDDIDKRLKEYDGLLDRELKSSLLQRPTKRHFQSLLNYLYNHKPIVMSEQEFLQPRDDFVLLVDQPGSPLEGWLDTFICWIPFRWFRRLFASAEQRNKLGDNKHNKETTLTSPAKISQFAQIIASTLAVLAVTIPVSVLFRSNTSNKTKLVTLFIASVFFPIVIQVTARPKNHDLFAATAAYCAVLVAFLAATVQIQFQKSNNGPGPS